MKAKAALALLILLIVMLFPVSVISQWPPMPQELAGGRPGGFRFSTSVQLQADRDDLADMRVSIERAQSLLPAISDPITRQSLQAEIQKWQLHVARYEQRLSRSAGPTAASAEARLNAIKGRRQCGVCHGGMSEPDQ